MQSTKFEDLQRQTHESRNYSILRIVLRAESSKFLQTRKIAYVYHTSCSQQENVDFEGPE